jgi:hypothetical protein
MFISLSIPKGTDDDHLAMIETGLNSISICGYTLPSTRERGWCFVAWFT